MAFTRIVNALATGGSFELFGDGDQSRSWTYVRDLVDGTIAALGGQGTYNVGGALEATMNESIALFERVSGRTLDVRRHDEPVPGDQRRTKADTTRIRTELGWEAHVTLEDGAERQWSWASANVTSA
jgi:UDP-glucose 4-epimerase